MMNNMDRISLLPDALLHRILSFLNIRSVIQTCVLSKRWKTLWTEIPTLNFDFDSFPFEGSAGNGPNSKYSSIKRFIFRVFSEHRCKSIKKLTYSSSIHTDEAYFIVELLLCYERNHPVRKLCINTFNTVYYDFPLDLMTCYSLSVLKITCGFQPDWEDLDFNRLRILEIQFDWEDLVHDLHYNDTRELSNCDYLESLVLVNCHCESISISAPKLENFELSAPSNWILTSPQFELEAPNLKTVKFGNVLPTIKSDSGFSCIHNVNLALDDSEFDEDGLATQKLTEFSQLLQVFHSARSFTLPFKAMEVLLSVPSSLSGCSFHNLRRLKLKAEAVNSMVSLPISTLMNSLNSPNLEMLEVDLNERDQKLTRALKALIKKTLEGNRKISCLSLYFDTLKENDREWKEKISFEEIVRSQWGTQ